MQQLVKLVVLMQGDDATEAFRVLYPRGAQFMPRSAMEHLKQWKSDCDMENVQILDTSGMTGRFDTKYHIMIWSYPFKWIVLYEKVTKKAVKEEGLLVDA